MIKRAQMIKTFMNKIYLKTSMKKVFANAFLFNISLCFLCLPYTQSAFAEQYLNNNNDQKKPYYKNHADGWHWYNEEIIAAQINKEDIAKEEQVKQDFLNSKDPIKKMEALQARIKRSLNRAILDPTDRNVRDYIALQNRMSNQATIFSNVWQKVLFENPDLNYSLVHPTNSIAKRVDLDLKRKKEDEAIAKLAKESGLFFFYSSSCLYCKKFAPIVKNFALRYKMSVIPITLDGIVLPEFPKSKIDKGQASKFNVTVEPSLFAVNPYSKKAYSISQGLVSEEALRKRILDIAQNFMGDL